MAASNGPPYSLFFSPFSSVTKSRFPQAEKKERAIPKFSIAFCSREVCKRDKDLGPEF